MRKIYLKAAKLIEEREEEFSCIAVENAEKLLGTQLISPRSLYEQTFDLDNDDRDDRKDPIKTLCDYDSGDKDSKQFLKVKNLRVWMLCMMAACWRDMR